MKDYITLVESMDMPIHMMDEIPLPDMGEDLSVPADTYAYTTITEYNEELARISLPWVSPGFTPKGHRVHPVDRNVSVYTYIG